MTLVALRRTHQHSPASSHCRLREMMISGPWCPGLPPWWRIRTDIHRLLPQAPSRSPSPTAVRSAGTCPARRGVAMLVPVLDERADGLFVVPSPRVERRVSITFCKSLTLLYFSPAFASEPARVTRTFARFSRALTRTMPLNSALAAGLLEASVSPSRSTCSGIAEQALRARGLLAALLRRLRPARAVDLRPPFCRVLLSFDASIGAFGQLAESSDDVVGRPLNVAYPSVGDPSAPPSRTGSDQSTAQASPCRSSRKPCGQPSAYSLLRWSHSDGVQRVLQHGLFIVVWEGRSACVR